MLTVAANQATGTLTVTATTTNSKTASVTVTVTAAASKATAATYVSEKLTVASTTPTPATTFDVTLGGKTYAVSKEKTTIEDQAAAWAEAYNADTETNGDGEWEAVADQGKITITYQANSDAISTNTSGINESEDGVTFTDGDGTNAAKVEIAAAASPSTTETSATTLDVTISGKTYAVDNKKTSIADQVAAWAEAYNADKANAAYNAAVEGTGNDSVVKLTAKVAGEKVEGADKYGTNLTDLSKGTFTNGTNAVDA